MVQGLEYCSGRLRLAVEAHVGRSEDIWKDFLRPAPKDAVTTFQGLGDFVPVGPLSGLIPSTDLDMVSLEYPFGTR